ncbi:MAG: hypothetical protein CVU12_00200 [Bacteroidetes bacterium HGW-Bacteroidetes-7]|jgi:AraC-like DNA-binding protein|nr:MAG: hypothetical protein CVU12_00200 [Bacteroidetes bacterium HGW-Bacteroidetes-7]
MKNSFFTESVANAIPSFDLYHEDNPVMFAYRTMEEIWEETGGESDDPHRHNFYTIIWVKQGTGVHMIDFTSHEMKPGRLFFLSPGQVHQVVSHTEPLGLVLMFTGDFLCKHNITHDFLRALSLFESGNTSLPLDIKEGEETMLELAGKEIVSLFNSEINHVKAGCERFKNEAVASWLKIFLIECHKHLPAQKNSNTQYAQTGNTLIGDFKDLLEENFSKWHQVSQFASALSVTADYLNNVIKDSTGVNAKEMIQQRIVLEARRLGVNTSLSSKEIAYSLGFKDPAHFSKFYKNVTGENFTDFRIGKELYNK